MPTPAHRTDRILSTRQADPMSETEGFFPERELLAYRRSLREAPSEPQPTAKRDRFAWWLPLVCMSPGFISMWTALPARGALLFFVVMIGIVLMIAVLGILFGMRLGWRTEPQSAAE